MVVRPREHQFDVIIVEALDRLSSDMKDLAGIHKRLSFLGIEIRAVHKGVGNTVLVGLRSLVGQLYREDNARKVRRGQAGRVGQGLNAGGLTYGYEPVPGDPGKPMIVEAEAEIVRRIFRRYVDGRTPRDIAHDLNAGQISSPRGRTWNASTIMGNSQRGTRLLNNELFVGRLVGNKVRMVKDPHTGRRISSPNPERNALARNLQSLRKLPIFDAVFDHVLKEWNVIWNSLKEAPLAFGLLALLIGLIVYWGVDKFYTERIETIEARSRFLENQITQSVLRGVLLDQAAGFVGEAASYPTLLA